MTLEEAVEIVLGGPQWVPCKVCMTNESVTVRPTECRACDGSNAELTEDYVKACGLLDIKLPSPWRQYTDGKGVHHIQGPAIYVGKFPKKQSLLIQGSPRDIKQFGYKDEP